jgi:hypothetical protein
MALVKVQSTTGKGALTLNSVAAGNLLVFFDSYYRASSTSTAEVAPTDTQGTWSVASAGVAGVHSSNACGCGIFYQENVASGTHVVTPQTNDDNNGTLVEFSGVVTSSPLDVAQTAVTNGSAFQSQVTGTTAATAQNDELVVICLGLASYTGNANVAMADVSTFTTITKGSNTSTDVAFCHAYKTVSSTGTQVATFTWTDGTSDAFAGAAIATFKLTGATQSQAPRSMQQFRLRR